MVGSKNNTMQTHYILKLLHSLLKITRKSNDANKLTTPQECLLQETEPQRKK